MVGCVGKLGEEGKGGNREGGLGERTAQEGRLDRSWACELVERRRRMSDAEYGTLSCIMISKMP